jgi:glycosyltransferase involved in cell wall biosynthesis
LRGTPAAGYREQIESLAKSLGVFDRLHFHAPALPAEMERMGSGFDIGYVGETSVTLNRGISLTNKLFSYLTSGLPIVASKSPAHVAIASQMKGAMTLFEMDNAAGLAAAFDSLLLNSSALADAKAKAWSLGQSTFSWEMQVHLLIDQVSRCNKLIDY